MGFWAWLLGKKTTNLGIDDGQAEYFKENFDPKENKKAKKEVKKKQNTAKPKPEVVAVEERNEPIKEALSEESPEVRDADTIKESKASLNGKFDIKKAKDGRFFFSLYASNGVVIAYSQMYSSLNAVNTGIKSIVKNMDKAGIDDTTLKKQSPLPCPKWEIYIDKAGEYRFRLYASNGQCVCHSSHGYSNKSGCKGGIESIRRFAKEARVDKSYLK